jgi:hypothetical protein
MDTHKLLKKATADFYAALRAHDQATLRMGKHYSDPDVVSMIKRVRQFNYLVKIGAFNFTPVEVILENNKEAHYE